MKRDWDTIREILTALENLPDTEATLSLSDFPEDRAYDYSYQMELLLEARLVEGKMLKVLNPGANPFYAQRLTWSGHEFLDSIRSDTVWAKTKTTFASKGIAMTFDLVKSVAVEISAALIRGVVAG